MLWQINGNNYMAKKKVATKKEKEHMRKVAELGCYACEVNGIENYAEVHHIRSIQEWG